MRATAWDELPLLLNVEDLRGRLGLSRQASYTLLHDHGLRLGRRMVVPKATVKAVLEREPTAAAGLR